MQTVAPAGSIAVSENYAQAVRRLLRAQAAGPDRGQRRQRTGQRLRGDRARAAADAACSVSARRGLTKFVGRERELEQMRRALEQALAGPRADRRGDGGSGHRQVAAVLRVQGDASVGLHGARDLLGLARQGHRRSCRCSNCCASYFGIAARTIAHAAREGRGRVVTLDPCAGRHAAVSVRLCSASSRAPIRWRRWTRRSRSGARSTRSSGSCCARVAESAADGDLRGPALDRRADPGVARICSPTPSPTRGSCCW